MSSLTSSKHIRKFQIISILNSFFLRISLFQRLFIIVPSTTKFVPTKLSLTFFCHFSWWEISLQAIFVGSLPHIFFVVVDSHALISPPLSHTHFSSLFHTHTHTSPLTRTSLSTHFASLSFLLSISLSW